MTEHKLTVERYEKKTFTVGGRKRRKTTIDISRKGSIVKEKCRQLSEQVNRHFSNGIIDDSDLTLMIEDLCGADKTTVRAYKGYSGHIRQGRCGDNRVVGLSHNGYLERFGFMRKIPNHRWQICQKKLLTEDMTIEVRGNENVSNKKISISPTVVDVVNETKEKAVVDGSSRERQEEEDTEKERFFAPIIIGKLRAEERKLFDLASGGS